MRESLARWQAPDRRRRRMPLWLAGAAAVSLLIAIAGWSWSTQASSLRLQPDNWVLVADFENATSDPLLDSTLTHVLERELTGSAFVNVVPRERVGDVLRLMRRAPDSTVDITVAHEVAQRDGNIHALVAGRALTGRDVRRRLKRCCERAIKEDDEFASAHVRELTISPTSSGMMDGRFPRSSIALRPKDCCRPKRLIDFCLPRASRRRMSIEFGYCSNDGILVRFAPSCGRGPLCRVQTPAQP
jgi:hypothetical protein